MEYNLLLKVVKLDQMLRVIVLHLKIRLLNLLYLVDLSLALSRFGLILGLQV
jgi:hypothetical protein